MTNKLFLRLFTATLLTAGLLLSSGCATLISAVTGPEQIDEPRGKRTLGTYIEDESIETKTKINLYNADPGFQEGNISAISFNGVVLLVGQLKSDHLRQLATDITQRTRKVRKVHNETTVSGPTSLVARSNDSWLTTKIKSRMLAEKNFPSKRVKVITEEGTVYLMGLVTSEEASHAVTVAKEVYGIQKIVKIFEYID